MVLSSAPAAPAQNVFEEYHPLPGLLPIGPGPDDAIPLTEKGYTLLLPAADGAARGVVLLLDPRRPGVGPPDSGSFDSAVLAGGAAVLHVTTGNPLDFLFADDSVAQLVERIQAILERHGARDVPLYIAGMSLAGTRALRLAVFLAQHADTYWLRLAAVAVVDAPLDMARLWDAERRAIAADFHPNAAGEGRWVTFMLERNLGGPPETHAERYAAYSPFMHSTPQGGNARYLTRLPLRAYHEPDVDWWIEHRRKDYYAMNSVDLAGLINQLRLLGSTTAELITTHRQRAGVDAGSSPHTWSIVDDHELVAWFLRWPRRPARAPRRRRVPAPPRDPARFPPRCRRRDRRHRARPRRTS